MAARPIEQRRTIGTVDGFTRFYRTNLPTVYGYLLRLCAGDRALAEDSTQDTWLKLVRELERGRCAVGRREE